MSQPHDFRRYAQRCTEIARHLTPEEADTLSAMAQVWTKLAEDEERIADLIRDADRAFMTPKPEARDGTRGSRIVFWDSDRHFH